MPTSIKRKLITATYVVVTTILLAYLQEALNSTFLAFVAVANVFLTFKLLRIGVQLQKALIPSITCRNCGTDIDLMSLWKCSCGYTLDHPRHAFDKCKDCGAKMSYFNCPKCDVSINL